MGGLLVMRGVTVWFLSCFGLKEGMDFKQYFGL